MLWCAIFHFIAFALVKYIKFVLRKRVLSTLLSWNIFIWKQKSHGKMELFIDIYKISYYFYTQYSIQVLLTVKNILRFLTASVHPTQLGTDIFIFVIYFDTFMLHKYPRSDDYIKCDKRSARVKLYVTIAITLHESRKRIS